MECIWDILRIENYVKDDDSLKPFASVPDSGGGVVPTRAALIAAVVACLLAAPAQAHGPYLTIPHARAVVQHYAATQGGTATSCQRVSRVRVDCGVSIPLRVSPGPGTATASATIRAFLREGRGPYLKRIGEWSYTITLPVP